MSKKLIAMAVAAAFLSAPAIAGEAEMMQKIEKMAAELEQLKAELRASVQKTAAVEQRQQALTAAAPTAAQAVTPATTPASATPAAAAGPSTIVSGYGEINYNRPSKNAAGAQTDLRRAVIAIEHRFDEKTKMVSEFEWEHGVVSADDKGESEVEQLYIERQFDNGLRGKVGLFLMPVGLLNSNHEPTAYYGVERNFVETAIIPSTWREVGLGLSGDLANGLSWDAGVTTGFDLNKWSFKKSDDGSDAGRESPLGSIHQEGQMAKSRDLSVHGALNWRGVPGLLLGGSVFTGKAGHKTEGFATEDSRITLFDLHGRYTPGRWDLSALYTRGQISNVEAFNLANIGNPTPVPSSFAGWYLQAAYQLYKAGDYTLSPFARYEQFNTAKSYSAMPQGLEVATGPDEKVGTIGVNLRVGEGVVLKADYQKFREDSSRDRLNLGMGFSY
ncbi:outer membrane murein-binding lipoprotein Lpp [Oxalobacteraceae bacterium GrIS 1.11]